MHRNEPASEKTDEALTKRQQKEEKTTGSDTSPAVTKLHRTAGNQAVQELYQDGKQAGRSKSQQSENKPSTASPDDSETAQSVSTTNDTASKERTPQTVAEQQQRDAVTVVDIRSPTAFRQGHVPGAINLPGATEELANTVPTTAKDIVAYCQTGRRSAAMLTQSEGANGMSSTFAHMTGGYEAWQQAMSEQSADDSGPADQARHPSRPQSRRVDRSQPALRVSQPDDAVEQEAERVADEIMTMDPATGSLSRSGSGSDCVQCQHRDQNTGAGTLPLQPSSAQPDESSATITAGETIDQPLESFHSGGRPLPDSERSFFEPRFGRDFTSVRLHTGSRADAAARSINAVAFTIGDNIVFRNGKYEPETQHGRRLLAHELTHVIQQPSENTLRHTESAPMSGSATELASDHAPVSALAVSERPTPTVDNVTVYRQENTSDGGSQASQTTSSGGGNSLDCENDPIDKIESAYQMFVAGGHASNLKLAAKHLDHFLSKKGGTVTVPHEKVLQDQTARQTRKDLLWKGLNKALTTAGENCGGGQMDCADSKQMTVTASKGMQAESKQIFYAMGRFTIELTADLLLTKFCDSNGGVEFGLRTENKFQIRDEYDWHPGLEVEIPGYGMVNDRCARRLKNAGRAKTFMMQSDWTEEHYFTISCQNGVVSIPSDPIPEPDVGGKKQQQSQQQSTTTDTSNKEESGSSSSSEGRSGIW